MVPMTTWQKFSTKEKVIYSTLALVLVFGAFALVSIATGGSSSSDGYGTGDTSSAKITLSGSCESGECDIRFDNETGGTDVIDGVPSIVQKFTVSNEEYEIYSISVRDGDRGEAKCSATIIVDQNVVDREEVTSNGTSAFCAVSTLIN